MLRWQSTSAVPQNMFLYYLCTHYASAFPYRSANNPVYTFNFQSQAGKLQAKYDQAVKRLAVLEEQLDGVKTGKVRQLRFNACHYTQEATIT